ncbi:MAG: hypothetical protein MHM6MM_002393 [Cercozoa sp. M6MM]
MSTRHLLRHEVFTTHTLLDKDTHPGWGKVLCATVWKENAVIAFSDGCVRMLSKQGRVLAENRNMFHKQMLHVEAVEGADLLFTLADSRSDRNTFVRVHQLPSLELVCQIGRTKDAHLFSTMSYRKGTLLICVAHKRRVNMFSWKEDMQAAVELENSEQMQPEKPRGLCFSSRSLCVAYQREYNLVDMSTGHATAHFAPPKKTWRQPPMCALPGGQILLMHDSSAQCALGHVVSPNASEEKTVAFTSEVVAVASAFPFVLGVGVSGDYQPSRSRSSHKNSCVEVVLKHEDTSVVLQRIDLGQALSHNVSLSANANRMFYGENAPGMVLLHSDTSVWALTPRSLRSQILQLASIPPARRDLPCVRCALDLYDAAARAKDQSVDSMLLLHLGALKLIELLKLHRFDEALALCQPNKSPLTLRYVLSALLPDCVPQRLRDAAPPAPDFDGVSAHVYHVSPLQQETLRNDFCRALLKHLKSAQDSVLIHSARLFAMCQVQDLRGIRDWLGNVPVHRDSKQTSRVLVDPAFGDALLSRSDAHQLHRVLLCKAQGRHENALDLLRKLATGEQSCLVDALQDATASVVYLQALAQCDTPEYHELVLRKSEWLLRDGFADTALSLFNGSRLHLPPNSPLAYIADDVLLDGTCGEDRVPMRIPLERVLTHLQRHAPLKTVVDFLETQLEVPGQEDNKQLRNSLIGTYVRIIGDKSKPIEHRVQHKHRLRSTLSKTAAQYDVHKALQLILGLGDAIANESYKPKEHLSEIDQKAELQFRELLKNFAAEKAVLFSRMSRHKDAFVLLLHDARDVAAAELHADTEWRRIMSRGASGEGEQLEQLREGRGVYSALLEALLLPSRVTIDIHYQDYTTQVTTQQIHNAVSVVVDVCTEMLERVDLVHALELLPEGAPICQLRELLSKKLAVDEAKRRRLQVARRLASADCFRTKTLLHQAQAPRVRVDEYTRCRVCEKRIGRAAFAFFPNGVICHYLCMNKGKSVCPVTGQRFADGD